MLLFQHYQTKMLTNRNEIDKEGFTFRKATGKQPSLFAPLRLSCTGQCLGGSLS